MRDVKAGDTPMKNLHSYLTILIIILFTTGTSEAGLFGDRDFDGSDLSIIASSFGTFLGSPGFNSDADLDSNGVVDNNDLSIFASFFGLSEKIFIERKSVMIPAATGGKITISEDESLYSQGFELTIPPNALSQDTIITVGDSVSDIYSPPDGHVPLGDQPHIARLVSEHFGVIAQSGSNSGDFLYFYRSFFYRASAAIQFSNE